MGHRKNTLAVEGLLAIDSICFQLVISQGTPISAGVIPRGVIMKIYNAQVI